MSQLPIIGGVYQPTRRKTRATPRLVIEAGPRGDNGGNVRDVVFYTAFGAVKTEHPFTAHVITLKGWRAWVQRHRAEMASKMNFAAPAPLVPIEREAMAQPFNAPDVAAEHVFTESGTFSVPDGASAVRIGRLGVGGGGGVAGKPIAEVPGVFRVRYGSAAGCIPYITDRSMFDECPPTFRDRLAAWLRRATAWIAGVSE